MNLLAERDSSGSVTAEYVHGFAPIDGIGSLVAARKTVSGATSYQYPLFDHRGTVYRIVDENGVYIVAKQHVTHVCIRGHDPASGCLSIVPLDASFGFLRALPENIAQAEHLHVFPGKITSRQVRPGPCSEAPAECRRKAPQYRRRRRPPASRCAAGRYWKYTACTTPENPVIMFEPAACYRRREYPSLRTRSASGRQTRCLHR